MRIVFKGQDYVYSFAVCSSQCIQGLSSSELGSVSLDTNYSVNMIWFILGVETDVSENTLLYMMNV